MANYGLNYQSQFDNINEQRYTLQILQLEYTGAVLSFTCAGLPVVQQCQTDDPKAPIKGSSLECKIINEGSLPISSFYSINDNQYKVKFIWSKKQLYTGNTDISVTGNVITLSTSLPVGLTRLQNVTTISYNGQTYPVISYVVGGGITTIVSTDPVNGSFPATDFVITYYPPVTLFEGFLVQDDFIEDMVDFTHELTLSANDGLGLLKDVPLDKFAPSEILASGPADIATDSPHTIILNYTSIFPIAGDILTITGTTFDGVYHVEQAFSLLGFSTYIVTETVATNAIQNGIASVSRQLNFDIKLPLLTIIQCCLKATNLALNTNIYTNLVEQTQAPGSSMLEQTLISTETFLKSEIEYDDCYNVLTSILKRFNLSLFQAKGEWHIIRWDELRLYARSIPYFKYDADFILIPFSKQTLTGVDITMSTVFSPRIAIVGIYQIAVGDVLTITGLSAGNGSYNVVAVDYSLAGSTSLDVLQSVPNISHETGNIVIIGKWILSETFTINNTDANKPTLGLTKRPFRPFKFDKETFNYKQPINLLKNSTLQSLGTFLGSYTTGTGINLKTFYKYNFSINSEWVKVNGDTSYIVVVKDSTGSEIDRYVFQPKHNTSPFAGILFNNIQMNSGDQIDLSFQIKTDQSTSGNNVTFRFGIFYTINNSLYYQLVYTSGHWHWNRFFSTPIHGIGAFIKTVLAADAENFTTINLKDFSSDGSLPLIPIDDTITGGIDNCALQIFIEGTSDTTGAQPNVNAIWNNLNFTVKNYVNNLSLIIGQTHEDFQQPNTKNNEDIEIFTDTSPRNTIAGTLFTQQFVSFFNKRADKFIRLPGETAQNLGNITTREQLFWRRITRTILEGTYNQLVQSDNHISLLSVIKFTGLPGLNFIFGKISIDYKNNNASGTLYEIYNDTEVDADLTSDYDFEYIYKTN